MDITVLPADVLSFNGGPFFELATKLASPIKAKLQEIQEIHSAYSSISTEDILDIFGRRMQSIG